MLGQSFGVFVYGPTCQPPSGFPEIVHYFSVLEVETSVWSPCRWVAYWWLPDGLPVVCSSHVQKCQKPCQKPCPAICSSHQMNHPMMDRMSYELRYVWMFDGPFSIFLGSFGLCFPPLASQAIEPGRRSSLVSSFGQVDVHDAEMLFHVLDDGLGSKRLDLFRTLLLSLPVGYGLKCQIPIPYHLLFKFIWI